MARITTTAERTAAVNAWRKKNPKKWAVHVKRRNVKRDYNISLEDYYAFLEKQNNCCGACGKTLIAGRLTHLDHDHKTGKIRGFLCSGCNSAAGFVNDDPGRLRLLAAYLERHTWQESPTT